MENARLITEDARGARPADRDAECWGSFNSSPATHTGLRRDARKGDGALRGGFRCPADLDGEAFIALHGWAPGELIDATREETLTPAADSLAERFVRGEKVISIDDSSKTDIPFTVQGCRRWCGSAVPAAYVGVALRKDTACSA